MSRVGETPIAFSRLLELSGLAEKQGRCRFTPFLTPPEATLAVAAAKRTGVEATLFGGYEGAERCMARFCPAMAEQEAFPITALHVTWPHQSAPEHRALLGSLMGLGIKRDRTGDIVLATDHATIFVETPLADTVAGGLTEAGRIRLTVQQGVPVPEKAQPEGEEIRFTVQSVRLDAIIGDAFHLSRGNAASLIAAGAVKLRHTPTLRPDAHVAIGDAISVRGYGRLRIDQIGEPTRKGRLPVTLTRFGALR